MNKLCLDPAYLYALSHQEIISDDTHLIKIAGKLGKPKENPHFIWYILCVLITKDRLYYSDHKLSTDVHFFANN